MSRYATVSLDASTSGLLAKKLAAQLNALDDATELVDISYSTAAEPTGMCDVRDVGFKIYHYALITYRK